MDGTPLSAAEVDAIERQVDTTFAAAELPTDNRYSSRWAVLRTCEDQLRFALLRTAEAITKGEERRQAVSNFIGRVNRCKYELKAALDLLDKRLPEAPPERVPPGSDGDVYTQAGAFSFRAASAYDAALTVFGPVRAGTRHLYRTQDGKLRLSEIETERSYPAIEALHSADDQAFSPIPFIIDVFKGPRHFDRQYGEFLEWGPDLKALVARTRVERERVRYQFVMDRARPLLEMFRLDAPDLPTDWRFPWGPLPLAAEVFAALATRAFYHLVAINFGADRAALRGGGVDQICLETRPEDLAKDLARLIDRPLAEVAGVLAALTYGAGVRNPDPALQPLIPIGKGKVLLPPFLVLTSAWGRNMLSLHARTAKASFDAQSHLFEKDMVAGLADIAQQRWRAWPNRHVPVKPPAG